MTLEAGGRWRQAVSGGGGGASRRGECRASQPLLTFFCPISTATSTRKSSRER